MSMYVKFADPQEFLNEISREKYAGRIDHPVIRFTHLLKPTNVINVNNLIAIATAHVGRDIFRMEISCGAIWANLYYPDACGRVQEIREMIEEDCKELGIELREGIFENEDEGM